MRSWRYSPVAAALILTAGLLAPTVASSQIPKGWVRAGADSVELVLMGSCWEKEDVTICADTWYMFREPDSLDLQIVEVGSGESLRVTFSRPPDDVSVMPFNGRTFEENADIDPSRFPAPTLPGTHYYAVSAAWEPGTGMWMFKVQVGSGKETARLERKELNQSKFDGRQWRHSLLMEVITQSGSFLKSSKGRAGRTP
ncbi:MAG: hypothetical protein HKO65_04355 [Gemmatimonadetes bacterium]|nr:hypothetical protein [Gemmatimonadota bacterium]NNM04312.1 hypothetical protein [Gemmatimonadota bacterium]